MNIAIAQSPSRLRFACLSFAELLSRGDLSGATYCFARNACLLTQDATAIHGRDNIRPALAQLIARGTAIEVGQSSVVEAGEVAWARETWTIRTRAPEGEPFEQATQPAFVMRVVEDEWKLAIAMPWR